MNKRINFLRVDFYLIFYDENLLSAFNKNASLVGDGGIHLSNDKKFDIFYKTILRAKKISRDSLGQNGIKIYNETFLSVKINSGDRLICFSQNLPGQDKGSVFVLAMILSHPQYERFIANSMVEIEKQSNVFKSKVFIQAQNPCLSEIEDEPENARSLRT